jgi:hypothetical protein
MLYANPKNPLRKIQHLGPAYVSSFSLLVQDLLRLTQYVQPADANLDVYSHRIYELLLRACTEWESLCKEVLQIWDPWTIGVRTNVTHYQSLIQRLGLEASEVGLRFWSPAAKYVHPFMGCTIQKPTPVWYAAYNQVKHNRNAEFPQATVANLCLAMAGLYATMQGCYWIRETETIPYRGPGLVEVAGRGWPFSTVHPTT